MAVGVLGSSRTEGTSYFVNFLATWLLWNVYVRRIRGRNVTRRDANHNLFFSSSWRHRFLLLQLRDAGTANARVLLVLSRPWKHSPTVQANCVFFARDSSNVREFFTAGRERWKNGTFVFRVCALYSFALPFKRTRYFRREDDFLFRILLYRSIRLERPCIRSNSLSVCLVTSTSLTSRSEFRLAAIWLTNRSAFRYYAKRKEICRVSSTRDDTFSK